jgi:hypothetical protein
VNPIWSSAWAAARRALRHGDHRSPPANREPMWKLLLGEAVFLGRLLLEPRRLIPAVAAVVLVYVSLSPMTPGPVADAGWRVVLAIPAAGFAAWAFPRHAASPERAQLGAHREVERTSLAKGAVNVVTVVALLAAVAAAAAYLLAVLVAWLF